VDESTNLRSSAASRRAFLAGAGIAGAAVGAVGAGAFAGAAGAAPATRGYTSGKFALDLDGVRAGAPVHASGGHAVGIVETESSTPTGTHKHVAGVQYEDISITCGSGMSKDFYQWITQCFEGKQALHSGLLTSREADGTVFDAVSFTDALISEVSFPALDAASKDAAKMTIKIRPASTEKGKPEPKPVDVKQKPWFGANFRLEIDGVDCTGVTTIEVLTVTQDFTDPPGAGKGATAPEPTTLEIPDLVLTTKLSHSKDFYDWHESLVIEGKDDKRAGSLTYLAADQHTELFTLTFSGLGIWVVDAIPPSVARQRAARIGCEVWCDGLTLKAHPAAVG
jgi:hypothetical protein